MASNPRSYGSFGGDGKGSAVDDSALKAKSEFAGAVEDADHGPSNNADDDESSLLPIDVEQVKEFVEEGNVKDYVRENERSKDQSVRSTDLETDQSSSRANESDVSEKDSSSLASKYRDKFKKLAVKFKKVVKDRDEMRDKYEKYISELRAKLKRSNDAGRKIKAEYQQLLAKNSGNNSYSGSSLIRNPLDLVKAAVSHSSSSSGPTDTNAQGDKNPSKIATADGNKEATKEAHDYSSTVEKLNKELKHLSDSKRQEEQFHQEEKELHLCQIAKLETEGEKLKNSVAQRDITISKLKKTLQLKIEQLDDFEKTKQRLKDLESTLLTQLDSIARVTNDKQMLEDQLKQVYAAKSDAEKSIHDLRGKISKQNKSKSKILAEAKAKYEEELDLKQVELDLARKEMLSMLNTTEAAEERTRSILMEKKKLKEEFEALQGQFQHLQQARSNDGDSNYQPLLATPVGKQKHAGDIENRASPLATPQSTPRPSDNLNFDMEPHTNDVEVDNIRKKHQKALQKISEQRSRFLQAAAEKAGFQSEMSALSARVKLQEIQLDQMRKSQAEKEHYAQRKQEVLEAKAKKLVEAAAKRKAELVAAKKALSNMKRAYSTLEDALNRGGRVSTQKNTRSNSTTQQDRAHHEKSFASRISKRRVLYPKTGELEALLTTIENLWDQLKYCDYAHMLTTERYRAKSPKIILEISTERLDSAEKCVKSLCNVFQQSLSTISTLLPVNGRRKMSTPVQKLVDLLLCFGSEIIRLRKRVNHYTEALLVNTFEKSDKFETEWKEQKVLVSIDVADDNSATNGAT